MPRYPEHDKLRAVKDKSQAIGSFIEFGIPKLGFALCLEHKHDDGCGEVEFEREGREVRECGLFEGEYLRQYGRIEKILADHFGINEDRLEKEKRKMIDECRRANAK